MGPPVRTVCVACLHSLEVPSGEEVDSRAICPYCGHSVDLTQAIFDTPTTGDNFASPPPPHPDALTPKDGVSPQQTPGRIGRFVIREPLGEGGYGQVFRAYDPHLDRDVALKVLKPNRIGEKALERFYREARAAARGWTIPTSSVSTTPDAMRAGAGSPISSCRARRSRCSATWTGPRSTPRSRSSATLPWRSNMPTVEGSSTGT